jgi:hypothetical protein
LNSKIVNLNAQKLVVDAVIAADPLDRVALKEKIEVEDDLAKATFDLTEEPEVILTMDEKAERSNVYRTHREDEQRLITNHGKVYALTIGQCTQSLKDKLKEDANWVRRLRFYFQERATQGYWLMRNLKSRKLRRIST